MLKTLEQWVEHFSAIDLPVLDHTLETLAGLQASASEVSGAQIASAVLPDPMMVLKVMRMVNSGRRNRFAQPVTTIEHSVMMVGLSASFNNMLSCPSLQKTLDPDAAAGMLGVVGRAYHAAFHARDWALLRLDLNVEEVYIAALLQELAELALWTCVPQAMAELQRLRRRGAAGADVERQILGFASDELAAELARRWTLPPLIASAFDPAACAAHPRPQLVSLARRIARQAEYGWYGEALQQDVAQLAETLRIHPDDAMARVRRVAAEAARNRSFPGFTPAAAWLPMLPGPWPDETAPVASANADPLQHAMTEIGTHLDGTLTLHELMQVVLKGMRDGIGLKRVVFALMTQDRSQLRAKYVMGAAEGSALKGFAFDMRQPHLFSRLLEKQQAFWLNDEQRPRVAPLLNDEIRRTTAADQFFVMSVAVRGKVVGLFYADGGEGRHALSAGSYDSFKQLCTQAALGMAHLAKST